MFYRFLQILLRPIFYIFWIKEINGIENVPESGPVIIAANHSSYMDFLCTCVVLRRRVYYLAAEKFYTSKFWKPIMRLTGQIKVERTSKDKSAVYAGARAVLESGNILGLFPEGTRSRDGKMHKAYAGVAKIALTNNVSILPLGINGAFEVWPPSSKLPKLKKIVKLEFGKPMTLDSEIDPNDFVNQKLMPEIARLAGLNYETK